MAFNPTEEQKKAIYRNGNILVSAAAGSGKTAVLVERVISKLISKTDGISADRLLIVTFTNAAAAEMRSRIEKRLDEEISKNPKDSALIMQKHLLSASKICTIDSFCIDLVRENFEKCGVAPDFKISDRVSLSSADNRVLSKIINRYLEEGNAEFLKLIDIIGSEFDESNFAEFILGIYNYSRQLPFPENWFNSLSKPYSREFDRNNKWWQYSFKLAVNVLKGIHDSLSYGKDLLEVSEKAYNSYYSSFAELLEEVEKLHSLAEKNDWDAFYNILNGFFIPSLPRITGVNGIPEIDSAKKIYKDITAKSIDRIEKLFFADTAYIKSQFNMLSKPLRLLSDILIEFDRELFLEYTRLNTYTFHNTEHLALSLLCEEENGKIIIKPQAEELLSRFAEVMVDEYQDTNDLQDMLFYVLSNRESKLFVVGDVKQSIYGFRGANPKNFLNKKNRYISVETATESEPQKIILGNNFRCKPEACDFINFFFERFMTNETGDIVYNEEERLIAAAKYPKISDISTELRIVAKNKSELSGDILEARSIAEYIKEIMASGNVIRIDEESLRSARFSDFTILLRSAKLKAPIFAEELKNMGIPISYTSEEFLETTEISTFISLLRVIDNPQSDIDLLTVMMSPIFSFSAEEMAELRIGDRKGDIYSTVITAAQNGNIKAKSFLDTLKGYRLLSVTMDLPRLISTLLLKTGYLDTVSALNDGNKKRNNLLLLSHYAEELRADGGITLSSFLRPLEKLSSGLKASNATTGSESVRIMSIHASKGLQFPVCIVAGTASKFNDAEARQAQLYSTSLGLGVKYFDEQEKTKLTTVGREVILDNARAERLEEELRLFYVAMTRTQDRLLFTANVSEIEKLTEKLLPLITSSGGKITKTVFEKTSSYLDWLGLCLLLHPDGGQLRNIGNSILVNETNSRILLKFINGENLSSVEEKINPISSDIDPNVVKQIEENINFVYPFSELLDIESKASVSKLANSAESKKYAFSARPEFMNKGGLTASQKGTAMHKVMEYFDFSEWKGFEAELERLYEWQYLTETEYNSVDKNALQRFFNSNIFKRILKSDFVKREMRFLTEMSATKIAPDLNDDLKDEKIIVQGAVDVCFIENEQIIILDFKTDRVDNINALADTYGEQLNIYATACEKIFNKKVSEKIIYSFNLGEEISI